MTAAFDRLTRRVDPAMVVVTASADGEVSGCLVGFHGQTSIEPRRWGVWISRDNHTHDIATRAQLVGVHFLEHRDRRLAELFGTTTGDEIDKFALCETVHREGVPMLSEVATWMVGEVRSSHRGDGDHTCLTLAPRVVAGPELAMPLRLHHVVDMEPGHEPRGS